LNPQPDSPSRFRMSLRPVIPRIDLTPRLSFQGRENP
jgi:hypothetical protein